MNPKYTKYIIFAVILLILATAWAGANKLKYDMWPWQMIKQANDEYQNNQTNGQNSENEESQTQDQDEMTQDEDQTDEGIADPQAFRQSAMKDLASKISQVSPVEAVLGGKWYVLRFWFSDNRHAYVEYEDGHIMRRMLVEIKGEPNNFNYEVLAYFEPGENDWQLKEGTDTMFGKDLDLYEFDESKNEWTKRN